MTKTSDQEEEQTEQDQQKELIAATIHALNDLPIISRLEFAKNLVFDKGGDRHNVPQDPVLIVINSVLEDVIRVLEKHPQAAQLRSPAPK
jgi:hypothetical protein